MKILKRIITLVIAFIAIALLGTVQNPRDYSVEYTHAAVKGITKASYLTYEKPVKDPRTGYNKGDEGAPADTYRDGEELFYNRYYDHWNVDQVYDAAKVKAIRRARKARKVTNRRLVRRFIRRHYGKNKKYKYIKNPNRYTITHRKNKKVIVEIVKSVSRGGRYGRTTDGYTIKYNKRVKKGRKVTSYFIWNPNNNYDDDVVAVVDNRKTR